MSGPNPFSTADAPQHNLVSKIVGNGPYHVVVDLVDVDTAYAIQLGSAADPVQQEYVTQIGTASNPVDSIYVRNIYPPPGVLENAIGGTGIDIEYTTSGPVISALVAAGDGIALSVDQNRVINLSTTLTLLNGPGIEITPFSDENNPNGLIISASGSTGGTGTASIPEGELVIGDGGAGLTSSPNVFFDSAAQLLYIPGSIINTAGEAGVLRMNTGGPAGDAYIESGFEDVQNSGNMLNISYVGGTADPTVTVDTFDSFVGINKSGPTAALDVVGQAVVAYDVGSGATSTVYTTVVGGTGPTGSITLQAGITYIMYAWGAGGAANGGVGGAGGYAEYQITPSTPTVLSWLGNYGGASGGGNALVGSIGASTFIVPGGGAGGVSGGTGGGGGEALGGRPTPEGGRIGGGGAAQATYDDNRSWRYTTVGGTIGGSGDIFNEGTIDGLTATVAGTLVVNLANPPVSVSINTPTPGVTYTIAAGTTMTFVTSGTVFNGATFSSPAGAEFPLTQVTGYIVNDAGELPSTTYTSIALYADWPNTTTPVFPGGSVDTGLTGITYGAGDVSWTGGEITYVPGTTFYLYFTAATDNQTSEEITVTSGANMTISSPFDFLTGVTLSTTGIGQLPTGSQIDVASRQFDNTGAVSTTNTGAAYGGGGGIGGGSPALVAGVTGMTYGTSTNEFAGGGGGAYQHSGSLTVLQVEPGVANRSYVNTFNRNGAYGAGGTAGAGGTQYLILQTKTDTGVIPPALKVYGDETVSGNLSVGGTATVNSLLVYGNGQINQNFLQNGNAAPNFGATFNSPLRANNGFSVTQGSTAGMNQETRIVWNQVNPGTGSAEILVNNTLAGSTGGVALYNQNSSVGPALVNLATFQQSTASILQPGSNTGMLTVNGMISSYAIAQVPHVVPPGPIGSDPSPPYTAPEMNPSIGRFAWTITEPGIYLFFWNGTDSGSTHMLYLNTVGFAEGGGFKSATAEVYGYSNKIGFSYKGGNPAASLGFTIYKLFSLPLDITV